MIQKSLSVWAEGRAKVKASPQGRYDQLNLAAQRTIGDDDGFARCWGTLTVGESVAAEHVSPHVVALD